MGSLFGYPQIPPPGVFKGYENELYKGLVHSLLQVKKAALSSPSSPLPPRGRGVGGEGRELYKGLAFQVVGL